MKIIFLSSCKIHHLYLISKVATYQDVYVFNETNSIKPKFETFSELDGLIDSFDKQNMKIDSYENLIVKQEAFTSINSPEVFNKLKFLNPDLIFVIGTGKISSTIVKEFQGRLINFHGGDTELYRGLDSHLWAIYHKDFNALKVTAHFVSEELDEGEIIRKENIDLSKLKSIEQLRFQNILTCEKILFEIIKEFKSNRKLKSSKQNSKFSRYYSFMPSDLKLICIRNFNNFKRDKNGK